MIIEALRAFVIGGLEIRNGDSAALLSLSDKLQNRCWAMIELQSNELDCTATLQQIFDHLPDPLQAKWRKSVKLYRDMTGGRELKLKELSAFITAELQTENDPVYGRSSIPATRVGSGNKSKRPPFSLKPAAGTQITTLATMSKQRKVVLTEGQTRSCLRRRSKPWW